MPAALILDNDGLLLDTESVWTRGERDLFERRGREFTLADKQELVGTSAEVAGAIIAQRLDEVGREAELIAELDELVLDELDGGVEPMVGARELVAAMRERGTPIGLVSNSPARFISRALELVEMAGEFGVVVSGHEVAAPKPAPDAYLEACRQLEVDPGPEVIVLEDSPTGVAAGKAAGLTVVGVPSLPGVELEEADLVVDSLADPALFERLGVASVGGPPRGLEAKRDTARRCRTRT
ncbi:MAG: HAD family hydrolase [Solirubrobacterales bacterium]